MNATKNMKMRKIVMKQSIVNGSMRIGYKGIHECFTKSAENMT